MGNTSRAAQLVFVYSAVAVDEMRRLSKHLLLHIS
jgi:hypothetical protein